MRACVCVCLCVRERERERERGKRESESKNVCVDWGGGLHILFPCTTYSVIITINTRSFHRINYTGEW